MKEAHDTLYDKEYKRPRRILIEKVETKMAVGLALFEEGAGLIGEKEKVLVALDKEVELERKLDEIRREIAVVKMQSEPLGQDDESSEADSE